ncbi:uncharacterized protein N7515_006466 [Penicillium bovifimosum]|uniref:Uncharacterized protein n=1 Tax=Penicillium bovifimosum TaxID=126998 RepID=A0A9W9L189_9EURO|nr:uncharacterized protein N7515_006466 [Penicillium bovifimosum]KAJ5130427.1 hypothetical protein N7515_006466 [Penicillium bovifimosum]
MTSIMRLRTTLQARSQLPILSSTRIQQPPAILTRSYANKSSNDPEQPPTATPGEKGSKGSKGAPIPSNKAKPTLSEGAQSPKDYPQDVKQHNKEMEERYDRPYNGITDEGTVEPTFKR